MVKLPPDVEISNLSDDDLFQKLKDLGVDVGPIVGSTRKLYELKLQRLLTDSHGSSSSGSGQEFNDDENDIDEETHHDHNYHNPEISSSPYLANLRRPVLSHSDHSLSSSSPLFQNRGNESNPRLEPSFKSHGNEDQPLHASSSSFGLFVKLAIGVAALAFLTFVVFSNMESDKENPIPNV